MGGLGNCQLHEVQQGQVLDSVHGMDGATLDIYIYIYKLGDERLESNPAGRDLGILVDKKLNKSQQCDPEAKRAETGASHPALPAGRPKGLSCCALRSVAPPQAHVQLWVPQHEKDMKLLASKGGLQKGSRKETSMWRGCNPCVCSA